MKKLLLVLLVVALAAFLLVGCNPVTPPVEGEGEGVVEICPTVAVSLQQVVGTKTYIKAGSQTITVTFAVPTAPVSVYVGSGLKTFAESLPGEEVVMYANATKTVYTGTFIFGKSQGYKDCVDAYIYVETCDTCAYCKYPYVVDATGPKSEITIASATCVCAGVTLTFKTPTQSAVCGVTGVCCGDACSGLASYAIDLYASDPFNLCCDIPCITPAYSCTAGVACPIDCTLTCITGGTTLADKPYWVVASLLDKVGNRTRYYAKVVLDTDSIVSVTEFLENKPPTGGTVPVCTDWTGGHTGATIGGCLVLPQ